MSSAENFTQSEYTNGTCIPVLQVVHDNASQPPDFLEVQTAYCLGILYHFLTLYVAKINKH